MWWFRSNLRRNSCLALIALAIQLAMSFGHVAHGQTSPLVNNGGPVFSTASTPTQNFDESVDLYCPICAAIRLSATLTRWPILPLPVMYRRPESTAPSQLVLAERPLNFAQARAPPALPTVGAR
jgi:hypothetical protein